MSLDFIDINTRRVISGPEDKLTQISPCKYHKPITVLDKMQKNNWFAHDVILVDDILQFKNADPKTKRMIQKALGFLSNLDGIQLNTLGRIKSKITSPEYQMAIIRQTYEEVVHVQTYDRIISTFELDPIETYNLFMTDDILRAKNEHIIRMAELLGDGSSEEDTVRAIAANQALEGIYFNMGFKLFYVLDKQGLFGGAAKGIRYINRKNICGFLA